MRRKNKKKTAMQPKGSVRDVLMDDYTNNKKYMDRDTEHTQFFTTHYREPHATTEEDEQPPSRFEDMDDIDYLYEDDSAYLSSIID